jgi:protein phosphatase 1 regulatory subunit 7
LAHLTRRTQANDNKLSSLDEVASQLVPLSQLETVYLEGNPLQAQLGTGYRRKLIDLLPQVTQIDATMARQV